MILTIIIPAYNAEDTIEYAIKSALKVFNNQEILIVDDGSTDKTGAICDMYDELYMNIKVIHTENYGVSNARNIGIENSTGDYIMFMDADDRICYDSALNVDNILGECDLILFSFNENNFNGKHLRDYIFEDQIIGKNEIPEYFLKNKYNFYGPWAKIFNKNIILQHNLRYNIGQKYSEDVIFVLNYLSCINNNIHLLPTIFYSHYINPNGASFYKKYYDEMNVYLFNQLKAFLILVKSTNYNDYNKVDDFASFLFNEVILHYYLRTSKEEFFTKYIESFKMFRPFLKIEYIKNYSFFVYSNIFSNNIYDETVINHLYIINYRLKIKFFIKKYLYTYISHFHMRK